MHYNKIIRYLEYFENGQKIKSAGFVKIELLDNLCNIQVNVTGLHPTENCTREIHLIPMQPSKQTDATNIKEAILGEITLQSGKGTLFKRRLPIDSLCEDITYYNLSAVRINLGKSRELVCRFREESQKEHEIPENVSVWSAKESQEQIKEPEWQSQNSDEVKKSDVAEPLAECGVEPHQDQPCKEAEPPQEEIPEMVQTMQNTESQQPSQPWQPQEPRKSPPSGPSMPATLHEKKWRQLSEIYPHIAPFRDERDYLSVGPGDFVILPEKYYRLINNSFLLHGFYNYGHMVLAKTMKRGEETYYIGVPGNFYEKERQVAIMFGFESFECRQEPATDGDFGYYMIRVEL
ncbi:MAG: hypothetical protein IKV27_01700 [Lachnospiraceae bacterium]|nr:hypothetical protein [Lachnospiraceae bacterium]